MSESIVLAADVGATNTRMRLSVRSASGIDSLAEAKARSGDAAEIKRRIRRFAATAPAPVRTAALGLPGKVAPDRHSCAISYLDPGRYVDFGDLFADLGVEHGVLLNDLECGVLGVQVEADEAPLQLCGTAAETPHERSRFVLGMPGTGLGVGLGFGATRSLPSEGGHILAAFDPSDELETAIRLSIDGAGESSTPTYEDVLRGGAIPRLFRGVVHHREDTFGSARIEGELDAVPPEERPETIESWAFSGTGDRHRHARETFRVYGRFLGRAMQALAVTFLPDAVYLGGGVVLATHRLFADDFVDQFRRHSVHGELLEQLPVYVVRNPDLNLDGATHKAISLLA